MIHNFLFALWFFAPAGFANVAPVFVAATPGLNRWQAPLDFKLHYRGKRLLGEHKTWRGLISGITLAILIVWLQVALYQHSAFIVSLSRPLNYTSLPIFQLGLLLGLGAVGGDAVKSFFKRQFKVPSGKSWFPFDQLDYIAGGLLLSATTVHLPAVEYVDIAILYFILHLIFSYLGYQLKLKNSPI